jgi:hypothetical protein
LSSFEGVLFIVLVKKISKYLIRFSNYTKCLYAFRKPNKKSGDILRYENLNEIFIAHEITLDASK